MRFLLISFFLIITSLIFSQSGKDEPGININSPSGNRSPRQTEIIDTLKTAIQDSLISLRKRLEKFEYSSVINGANWLLSKKDHLLWKDLIGTYLLKGISHFALTDDENAEKSFTEILKIDSTFTLDSTKISPKIISFFKKVKENFYRKAAQNNQETAARIDTVYIPHIYEREIGNRVSQAVLRSIIFPGLGHLYRENSVKAWTITGLSGAAIGSLIYFWIDSDRKEKLYLKESNPGLIDYRYKKYNRSYQLRNISIAAAAGIWLYSQIDLLFFSDLFEINFTPTDISGLNQFGITFTCSF